MGVLVVQCNPKSLAFDGRTFPDRDKEFLYDHLKHYCSKFRPFPAATITLKGASPIVIQGHKYVRAALDLGVDSIRAIVEGKIEESQVQTFLKQPDVQVLDWKVIQQEESESSVLDAWHVFFFEDALSQDAQQAFEERIPDFFRNLRSDLLQNREPNVLAVKYEHNGTCAEFIATTPAGDSTWFEDFHAVCLDFHTNVARIASYQGRHFKS